MRIMKIFNYNVSITIKKDYPNCKAPIQKRYREKKRMRGFCINGGCWNKVENNRSKCPICMEKDRKRWKVR